MGIKKVWFITGASKGLGLSLVHQLLKAGQSVAAYEEVRAIHDKYLKMDGQQIGDPEKAAAAMISLASMPNPPVHLLLGNDAFQRANNKLESLRKEFTEWKAITISTDFDKN